jgi:Ca2+-binding EF-hand superfamily protein
VRQKINCQKARLGLSWDEIFKACDADGSGDLSFKEFVKTIRTVLGLSERTVCVYDLRVLFDAVDVDKSGDLDKEELYAFLSKGQPTQADLVARGKKRFDRAWKAVTEAFGRMSDNESDIRFMFRKIDADGSGIISEDEFIRFVRSDLQVSKWLVKETDLGLFYKTLDTDGDGLEVEELIRHCVKEKDSRSVPKLAQSARPKLQTTPTYRQVLLKDCMGSYRLSISESAPTIPSGASFLNLGRSRAPTSRYGSSSIEALSERAERTELRKLGLLPEMAAMKEVTDY